MVRRALVVHKAHAVRPLQNAPLVQPLLLPPQRRDFLRFLSRLQLAEPHLLLALLGGARRSRDGDLLPFIWCSFGVQLCLLPFCLTLQAVAISGIFVHGPMSLSEAAVLVVK